MENSAKKFIAITTPLALITSVTYLFAYWSTFKINIFEYLQISELIVFSILPFVTTIAVLVASTLFSHFIYPFITTFLEKDLESGEKGLKSKLTRRLKKWGLVFIGVQFIFFMWWITVAIPMNLGFWEFFIRFDSLNLIHIIFLGIPFFIAYFFMETLEKKGFGKSYIDNGAIRKAILYLSILLPLEGAAHGKVSAETLKSKSNYLYVKSDNFPKNLNLKYDEHIRYIGKASNYFFFLSSDRETIVIIKDSQIMPLKLQHHNIYR